MFAVLAVCSGREHPDSTFDRSDDGHLRRYDVGVHFGAARVFARDLRLDCVDIGLRLRLCDFRADASDGGKIEIADVRIARNRPRFRL